MNLAFVKGADGKTWVHGAHIIRTTAALGKLVYYSREKDALGVPTILTNSLVAEHNRHN